MDEAPLDVNMNSAEIESIVSSREQKAEKTASQEEVKEMTEVNDMDVSINDVGKQMKDQATGVVHQESVEVPLNSMKDILDQKMD